MIPKRIALLTVVAALGGSLTAHAQLPLDQITVAKMPTPHPYRLYFTDVNIPSLLDGKMTIIDGRNLKVEGMVHTGTFGQTTVSPDRSEIYAVTTYFTKGNRGERSEEIVVYDATTLKLKAEIPYPARHAQALPYRGTMRTSGDGRFLFIQNATPATSIGIVDLKTRKMVADIAIPGCYNVYPSHTATRVSTLCGDGTMLTIALDGDGNPIGKQKSAKFFDPDEDALFVTAAQEDDRYHFVSFRGNLVTVDLSGEVAQAGKPWPLLSTKEAKGGWRPGGYQPVALHRDSGTLYVGMHPKGFEGSHKNASHEVWTYDFKAQRLVARNRIVHSTGLAVSQGAEPRLFAYDTDKAQIAAYDGGRKLKLAGMRGGFGFTPTLLEAQ